MGIGEKQQGGGKSGSQRWTRKDGDIGCHVKILAPWFQIVYILNKLKKLIPNQDQSDYIIDKFCFKSHFLSSVFIIIIIIILLLFA